MRVGGQWSNYFKALSKRYTCHWINHDIEFVSCHFFILIFCFHSQILCKYRDKNKYKSYVKCERVRVWFMALSIPSACGLSAKLWRFTIDIKFSESLRLLGLKSWEVEVLSSCHGSNIREMVTYARKNTICTGLTYTVNRKKGASKKLA